MPKENTMNTMKVKLCDIRDLEITSEPQNTNAINELAELILLTGGLTQPLIGYFKKPQLINGDVKQPCVIIENTDAAHAAVLANKLDTDRVLHGMIAVNIINNTESNQYDFNQSDNDRLIMKQQFDIETAVRTAPLAPVSLDTSKMSRAEKAALIARLAVELAV